MNTRHLTASGIAWAADRLRNGGLVVFPTETVYGLGADARREDACRRIFAAKGRPVDNPLIVHVAGVESVASVARNVPPDGRRLMAAFWPGPLTLVLPKTNSVCRAATARLDTVAVRCPDHEVARSLIQSAGVPVAAPSANRSGRPSPTSFEMAVREMDGRVDAIIDGGRCLRGIESTVLRVGVGETRILRPGSITREMIEEALGHRIAGPAGVADPAHGNAEGVAASPGTKHAHYQPEAAVYVVEEVDLDEVREAFPDCSVGVLCLECGTSSRNERIHVVSMADLAAYAHGLYRAFHELDALGCGAIVAELPPSGGLGDALRDRLLRASGGATLDGATLSR